RKAWPRRDWFRPETVNRIIMALFAVQCNRVPRRTNGAGRCVFKDLGTFIGANAKPPRILRPPSGAEEAAAYTRNARTLSSAHGVEEFGIVLGLFHLVDQEFGGLQVIHRIKELAQ